MPIRKVLPINIALYITHATSVTIVGISESIERAATSWKRYSFANTAELALLDYQEQFVFETYYNGLNASCFQWESKHELFVWV